MDELSHLGRRQIEARLIARFYERLCSSLDQDSALETVRQVLESAASEEGQAFARLARPQPSLKHFSDILGVWDGATLCDFCYRWNI